MKKLTFSLYQIKRASNDKFNTIPNNATYICLFVKYMMKYSNLICFIATCASEAMMNNFHSTHPNS